MYGGPEAICALSENYYFLIMKEITNYFLLFSARIGLLNDLLAAGRIVSDASLISHLSVAGRILIASNWKSEIIPGKKEQMEKVQNMIQRNKLSAIYI